jgi:hypothetical protein
MYHSYPNPEERPVISTTQAPKEMKKLFKDGSDFYLHDKFRLDLPFSGTPPFKPIVSSKTPPTLSTRLENGLTVATQETPGLMSSIAFIVRTGR